MSSKAPGGTVERLVTPLSQSEKVLLQRAAAIEGCSVEAFVVAHAREAAEKTILQHEAIRLNDMQSVAFVEALLSSCPALPKVTLKAVARYRRMVEER